ncbi:Transferase [Apiospora sp. TS-2023a]
MALLWASVTRAKLDLLKPEPGQTTKLLHGVNTREIWAPPLLERHLGVGACGARCDPLLIANLTAPSNLPRIASAVRASTNRLKRPGYLAGLARWIARRKDKRWLSLDFDAFLGPDMGATSWQSMSAYATHDFGFGGPPRRSGGQVRSSTGLCFCIPAVRRRRGPTRTRGWRFAFVWSGGVWGGCWGMGS